jgi:uncharacterized protein YndB with AHSA1/START domain
MAIFHVLIDRPPRAVWAVLSDGRAYAEWVAGTREIREVDHDWPQVGARIGFVVGAGPLTWQDRTIVRMVEPEQRLELEAHAGRLGTARISITILPWGESQSVVIVDEHPLSGLGERVHNVALDVALRFRNRRMVRTLGKVVEERHPPLEVR